MNLQQLIILCRLAILLDLAKTDKTDKYISRYNTYRRNSDLILKAINQQDNFPRSLMYWR